MNAKNIIQKIMQTRDMKKNYCVIGYGILFYTTLRPALNNQLDNKDSLKE